MRPHEESVNFFGGDNMPFIIFFVLFAFLAWDITAPISTPILWAAVLSFISMPIYRLISRRLMRNRFPSVASGVTLALLLLICIVPVLYALSTLGSEAAGMGAKFSQLLAKIQHQAYSGRDFDFPAWLPLWAADYLTSFLENSHAVKTALQFFAQWSAKFLSSLSAHIIEQGSSFILNAMIATMISFFFIRDGEKIVNYVKSVVPLSPEENEAFFFRTGSILNSIVYGIILTVALQALVGGVGWWFVGLGSPALFGMLMFFFGMFPAGTAVVWVPGSIYLALTGDIKNAAILFVWGLLVVGTIDNLLRPFLISGGRSGRGEIPTLLIIMGLFGGVMVWGFLGIFVGPLILVLFISVCDLYRKRWLRRQER